MSVFRDGTNDSGGVGTPTPSPLPYGLRPAGKGLRCVFGFHGGPLATSTSTDHGRPLWRWSAGCHARSDPRGCRRCDSRAAPLQNRPDAPLVSVSLPFFVVRDPCREGTECLLATECLNSRTVTSDPKTTEVGRFSRTIPVLTTQRRRHVPGGSGRHLDLWGGRVSSPKFKTPHVSGNILRLFSILKYSVKVLDCMWDFM